MISKKEKADGICGVCSGKVPLDNINLFYCSELCRREAWKLHHPNEIEPDWDNYPKVIYY